MQACQVDYTALKKKIQTNPELIKNVEEVINLDVLRSFNQIQFIHEGDVLTNLLKTYAFFNPEIEYCQGMNFIAGFLYLVFRDEEMAFKAMLSLIDRFNMTLLFN